MVSVRNVTGDGDNSMFPHAKDNRACILTPIPVYDLWNPFLADRNSIRSTSGRDAWEDKDGSSLGINLLELSMTRKLLEQSYLEIAL